METVELTKKTKLRCDCPNGNILSCTLVMSLEFCIAARFGNVTPVFLFVDLQICKEGHLYITLAIFHVTCVIYYKISSSFYIDRISLYDIHIN